MQAAHFLLLLFLYITQNYKNLTKYNTNDNITIIANFDWTLLQSASIIT